MAVYSIYDRPFGHNKTVKTPAEWRMSPEFVNKDEKKKAIGSSAIVSDDIDLKNKLITSWMIYFQP